MFITNIIIIYITWLIHDYIYEVLPTYNITRPLTV